MINEILRIKKRNALDLEKLIIPKKNKKNHGL